MVSYYNHAAMYRHQQAVSSPNAHFQTNSPMHSWYPTGYHHQAQQMPTASSYCVQDEQQMWHHPHPHSMFHNDFQDFVAHSAMPLPQHTQVDPENQLPSPPITVSGSEMSSPGAGSGNISPQNHTQGSRPPPARSPYEWIKKTSYQTQPNPGKTRTKDKYRVVYTDHQRIELEKEFTFNNKYITIRRKSELASNLGLSERQIKIWFQNRRAKERKQNKKRVEEKHQHDISSSIPYHQNHPNMINQHTQQHLHQQHIEMANQTILPNTLVPHQPSAAMQRYMESQNMKLESSTESDQLG